MIEYEEDWLLPLLFRTRGSLTCRAVLYSVPSALLCLLFVCAEDFIPDFRKEVRILDSWKGPFWSAITAALAMLLGFRTNLSWSRFWEGTTLLHMMRGEWFDSVSCCVTFSRAAMSSKPDEVNNFRHTLVRLMSLCHASALEEICGDRFHFETIDTFGLDSKTLKHLKACKEDLNFNRVEVLLHMTQVIITKALEDNVVKIPPPILSRVYQTLSKGFVHLLNAKKIKDTHFPFPWAQLLTMLLFLHWLLTPIVFAALMRSRIVAPIITFIATFAFCYLDFTAIELENPFGQDSNDLPLEHFQSDMNQCLVMLLQGDIDHVPTCSVSRAKREFQDLQDMLTRKSQVIDPRAIGRAISFGMSDSMEDISARHGGSKKPTKRITDFTASLSISASTAMHNAALRDADALSRHPSHTSGSSNALGMNSHLSDTSARPSQSHRLITFSDEMLLEDSSEDAGDQDQETGLSASMFVISTEQCQEPACPLVQLETPHRARRRGQPEKKLKVSAMPQSQWSALPDASSAIVIHPKDGTSEADTASANVDCCTALSSQLGTSAATEHKQQNGSPPDLQPIGSSLIAVPEPMRS